MDARPGTNNWPFYIKDDGVHFDRWVICKGGMKNKPWLLVASQRCCAWYCPSWQSAVDLMNWFAEMCASPRLIEPLMPHIRHMRDGVVFPMRAEEEFTPR